MKIFWESSNDSLFDDVLSDFFVTFSQIFSTLKLQNIDSKRVKHCKNWRKLQNQEYLRDFQLPNFKNKNLCCQVSKFCDENIFREFKQFSIWWCFYQIFWLVIYKYFHRWSLQIHIQHLSNVDLIELKLWIWRFSLILPSKL